MSGLTPKLPLIKGNINNYLMITEYKELVKQNFKNLMYTIPGERIMDSEFGIGLKRFLFEMDNPGLYGRITGRIKQQVNKYLSYITIDDVIFNSAATTEGIHSNFLSIRVEYTIIPLSEIDNLELTLPID